MSQETEIMRHGEDAASASAALREERIAAALLDLIGKRQLRGAVSSFVVAVLVFLAISRPENAAAPAAWLAFMGTASALRTAYGLFSLRKARESGNPIFGMRYILFSAVLVGVSWSAPIFLTDPGDSFNQAVVIVCVAGVVTGAVSTFVGHPACMSMVIILPVGSLIWWFGANITPIPFAPMAVFAVFALFSGYVSLDTHRRAVALLRLGFENVDLVEELKASERQVRELANRDELTGLPNRRLLAEFFTRAESEARRHKFKLAVLFVDLDDFKPVNDRFGHETGDEVLRQVAQAMRGALRDVDTLARVGGDEFVAVVEGVVDVDDAQAVAERLAAALAGPILALGHEVRVGASIGAAIYPDEAGTMTELMALADSRMYSRKAGDSCVLDSEGKAR